VNLEPDLSYDVRIWSINKYVGKRGTTYAVRWLIGGARFRETFANRKLADSFRAELMASARAGTPFDRATGLPHSPGKSVEHSTSWFEFAIDYMAAKWPTASPRHRKGIAEALTGLTVVLVNETGRAPDPAVLREALTRWSFNSTSDQVPPPGSHADALEWLQRASVPLVTLADPVVIRAAADALGRTLTGMAAAPSTVARKRATLNNALEHAVETGRLAVNPLRQTRVARPTSDDAVDRRVVVNPTQAKALLHAVEDRDPALHGFFACLYYAGMRPAEARNLRQSDCWLPETGWGRTVLTGSHQYAGARWTDSGDADEERALKHRSARSTRPIPLHPELVAALRQHLDRYGTGADDRLFVTRTGKAGAPLPPPYLHPVSMKSIYRAWHQARERALTPQQAASVLGKRPYDLRHACLSTWLNAGVSAAQVAEWAGHSVEVLLRVYTNCLDGQEEAALRRIDKAFAADDD
jgi:integrase